MLSALPAAGAADAWLVPILMKKGRPAHTLCVLTAVAERAALRDAIFVLTPTPGVRGTPVSRVGPARGRRARRADRRRGPGHGGAASGPDHRGHRGVRGRGVPVRQVLAEAGAAAEAAGLRPGAPGEDGSGAPPYSGVG
ncbi:MAG: DUF111 family protein [Pseudonocardia sp.]|nr:DUF111 family protein [Pseudonocardia sp.]